MDLGSWGGGSVLLMYGHGQCQVVSVGKEYKEDYFREENLALALWQYRRLFSAQKLKTWKSFDSLESIKMTHFSLILMHGRAHSAFTMDSL